MERLFEVGIYNESVRAAMGNGTRHRELAEDWADIHYIEVHAEDESTARRRIEQRYPPTKGFVITQLTRAR